MNPPHPPVAVRAVIDVDGFEALREEWNELLEASFNPSVFLTHDWARAWWDAYGSGRELFILLGRVEGRLDAVLPLYRSRLRTPRWLALPGLHSLTNDQSPRFDLMLRRVADPTSVVLALLEGLAADRRWICCELFDVPDRSPTSQLIRGLAPRSRLFTHSASGSESPFLEPSGSWEGYFAAVSSDFKRKLRRSGAKLETLGPVETRLLSSPSEADRFLGDLEAIESRTWKHREGTSLVADPAHWTFYTSFVRRASRQGWLRGYVVYLRGEPAAYDLCVQYGGTMSSIKIGYREDLRAFGLGHLLHRHILEEAYHRGVTRFDFLGKSEPHKLHWTATVEPIAHLRLFRSRLSSWLLYLFRFGIRDRLRRSRALRDLRDRIRHPADQPGTGRR